MSSQNRKTDDMVLQAIQQTSTQNTPVTLLGYFCEKIQSAFPVGNIIFKWKNMNINLWCNI
jgi:hypothetical protein